MQKLGSPIGAEPLRYLIQDGPSVYIVPLVINRQTIARLNLRDEFTPTLDRLLKDAQTRMVARSAFSEELVSGLLVLCR